MKLPVQLAVVAVAACLCLAEGAPEGRLTRPKQQRQQRGFKTVEMMTARGFGKRDRPAPRAERDVHHTTPERTNRGTPTFKNPTVGIARDYGKRSHEETEEVYGPDNFWDTLESSNPEKEQVESEEKVFDSIPVDWFANELVNNQEFAKSVVRKFIDVNQDGVLSPEELLRTTA